jgi:hypothetical protein
MLSYKPPFVVAEGLTAFPDHADPEAFYYIVSVPELVQEAAGPAFWATAILPPVSVGAGPPPEGRDVSRATLSFDVQLAAAPAALEELAKEIERRGGRPAKRLVPAPLAEGQVSLVVARPGADAGAPSRDFFVYQGHPPALVGANRAALAIAAEGLEAQVLVASLTAGHVPAVLSYELAFLGLAPSFEARMRVRWEAVYRLFRERETTNFLFVAEDVDRTIERLEEARAVEIEVRELDPEGAKGATKALFDELRSQVLKKLFESPRPVGTIPVEDRIARGVRDVLQSIMLGSAYTLRQLDQSALTETVIDLRGQQARTYPFYPQSSLTGLLRRAGGVDGRLSWVRLDELPNRREEVLVELAAGAEAVGVTAVLLEVQALAPDRAEPLLHQTVRLEPGAPRQTLAFRRLGAQEPVVRYRAEMSLQPELAPEGRERWRFGWREVEGGRIWFNPEEWLDVAALRVEVDDPALFALPAAVEMDVECRLDGDPRPFRRAHLRFTREAPAQTVSVVLPEGATPVFRGAETFRRQGEPDFVREVPAIAGAVHRIMNPFGQAWSMEVRGVLARPETESLFAELRVWDPTRRVWLHDEHRFTREATSWAVHFSTSLQTPRTAEARVTRVDRDGAIVRGPWTDLAGPVVAVTDAVQAVRRVRATLAAPRFEALGVRKAWLELEYQDPAHGVAATGRLDFGGDGDVQDWVHPFPDPARPKYRYRLRALGEGGERFNGPWTESAADDLAPALPDSPW